MKEDLEDLALAQDRQTLSSEAALLIGSAAVLNRIRDDQDRNDHLLDWAKYLLESYGFTVAETDPSKNP